MKLSLTTASRTLRKLGTSPQRPVYRGWYAAPGAPAAWKAEGRRQMRTEAKRQHGVISFSDEASVRTAYHAGITLAPVACTTVLTSTGAHLAVKILSAISPCDGLRFRVDGGPPLRRIQQGETPRHRAAPLPDRRRQFGARSGRGR